MTERPATGQAASSILIAALVACLAAATLAALPLHGITGPFLLAGVVLCAAAAFVATGVAGHGATPNRVSRLAVALGILVVAALTGLLLSGSVGPDAVWFTLLGGLGWIAGWWSGRELAVTGSTEDGIAGFPARRRLVRRFLVLTAVLLVLVALTHGTTQREGLALAASVTSLLLTLTLMVRSRYVELERRWHREERARPMGLGGRWQRLALAFVTVLALAGALATVSPVPGWLGLAGQAGKRPFVWLVGPILALLNLTGAPDYVVPGRCCYYPHHKGHRRLYPGGSRHPPLAVDVLALVGLALLLLSASFVAYAMIRSRRESIPFTVTLLAPFRRLWRWLHRTMTLHLWALADRLPEPVAATLFRTGRPSRLGPRERVIWHYLNTARRAERVGLAREPADTPAEYDELLGPFLAEARTDLSTLTASLVEARYTDHVLDEEAVQRARASAQRVRGSLRRLAARESEP